MFVNTCGVAKHEKQRKLDLKIDNQETELPPHTLSEVCLDFRSTNLINHLLEESGHIMAV